MLVPSYVRYKNLPYILVESNGNMGKILDPCTQKKLHVLLTNLTPIGKQQPIKVTTELGDYFVTPKGTIVSVRTLRNVYRQESPQRLIILQEADRLRSSI